jgi:hypothetical protein
VTDLPPPMTVDQLTGNLAGACGDGDAVRLATLIRDNTAPEGTTFTRPELISLWTARWSHHATNPAQSRRPQYRIQRALPRLTTSLVLGPAGDGTDSYKIAHADGLALVASRIGAANSQDAYSPNNVNMGVGAEVLEAVALMAGVILGAATADQTGGMTMTVTADVVKAGGE